MTRIVRTEPIVPIPQGVTLPRSANQPANVRPVEEISYPDPEELD